MESTNLGPEAIRIAEALSRMGLSAYNCVALVRQAAGPAQDASGVMMLKDSLKAKGIQCEGDTLERTLLGHAIDESVPRVDELAVYASVKPLIRREFERFRQPAVATAQVIAGTDPFVAASRICTLQRFPSGPLDWVVSGMPRSWLAKIPLRNLVSALRFITLEFGGLSPAFYVHVAHPPRNRSLAIEKEVRRAYYRMARSLALCPSIKGIMCASWFHDPAARQEYPHLDAINEPYVRLGGRIVTTLGPAPLESGFLKFNPQRRERYERGELVPMTGLAMWPRQAAIAWAEKHTDLDTA